MYAIRFAILLIFLAGIGAGLLGLLDRIDSSLVDLLFAAGLRGFVLLFAGGVMVFFVASFPWLFRPMAKRIKTSISSLLRSSARGETLARLSLLFKRS